MTGRFRCWIALGCLVLFALCVGLKLNGSSIGIWSDILYQTGKPSGLLFSTPKHVRADEWHGWTPAALSQARQTPPFPIQNLSLGGERAPLLMSIPVSHYTMFFRPQFWGFFIFDFERGFSFFWCAKIFGLLAASWWFLRRLGIRDTGCVLFGTIWIFFSSYVQWWFSSPAMLPEMLATWMVCTGCALEFFKGRNSRRLIASFAVFVFAGVNFALCVYPPYQIPLLWLMVAILIGACLELRSTGNECRTGRGISLTIGAIALVLAFLIPFWIDARSTLDLVANTDYPGSRRSTGGDLSIFKLFSGIVAFFETEKAFPAVYDNVCEASNFYPLWPAALAMVAFARWKRKLAIPSLIASLAIVMVILSAYCVLAMPGWILNPTLLSLTTERRTLLAIGIANILLCTIFLDRYREQIFSTALALIIGIAFWVGAVVLIWSAGHFGKNIFSSRWQISLEMLANGVLLLFFLESRRRWFTSGLAALLILSNAGINPIMDGLSPLIRSEAFREIDALRQIDPQARWLVYHDYVLAQLVIATGAPVLNGNKIVPDFGFLRRLDPEGGGKEIYNRYAYVGCELPNESEKPGVRLIQHDLYALYLLPDAPPLREAGCRFFLFPEPWPDADSHGFSLAKEISQSKLYIYRSQSDGSH